MGCLLCGSAGKYKGRAGYNDFVVSGRSYAIKFCQRCKIGKTVPFPDEAELRAVYSSEQYREDDGKRFLTPIEWMVHALRIFRCRRVERCSEKGRVLDIGCGRSDFLSVMAGRGWEVTGLEMNERAADYAKDALGLDVRVGTLKDQRFPNDHFDAVTLWHVFEHFRDPALLLKECRRILKPGGLLVVAIPNRASLQARLTGNGWFHLDVPYHLYHFSLGNLKKLIGKGGFKYEQVNNYSFEYNPYGLLQSFYNRLGFRRNLLYDLLKRTKDGSPRSATVYLQIACTVLTLPVMVPLSVLFSYAESFMGLGGSIEIYARKGNK